MDDGGGIRPRRISLDVNADERGNLVAIQNLPFEIKRVFTLTNLNRHKSRANHAVSCDEFITVLSGRCRLVVKSRTSEFEYVLSDPGSGFFIPAGFWIRIDEISDNTCVLVACSEVFEKTKYHPEPQI